MTLRIREVLPLHCAVLCLYVLSVQVLIMTQAKLLNAMDNHSIIIHFRLCK